MTRPLTRYGQRALPAAVQRPLLAATVPAALLVALLAVGFSDDATASELDRDARSTMLDLLPDSGDGARAVDYLGEPRGLLVGVVVTVVGCMLLRRPRLAVLAVIGPGSTVIATSIVKHVVDRRIHGDNLCYPSGHTASATALGLVLGLLVMSRIRATPVWGTAVILAAGATVGAVAAWSQIVLDAHYPTDTAAGLCVAMTIVPCCAWALDSALDRLPGPGSRQVR